MSLERSAANFCTYSSWTFKSSSLFKRIVGAMMPMDPASSPSELKTGAPMPTASSVSYTHLTLPTIA